MGEAAWWAHMRWSDLFHLAEGYDSRQTIGRYCIRLWDKEEQLRILGFRLYARYLPLPFTQDLGWDILLCKWELEERAHPYTGVLRDLWSLPVHPDETPYGELTAGKLLWFLHCLELTHPFLFAGPREYSWSDFASPNARKLA